MFPVNQVILGGGDPLLTTPMSSSIEEQIQLLERQKQVLENARQQRAQFQQSQAPTRLVWDEIDLEMEPMTNEQKEKLFQDSEYVDVYTRIQNMVQSEIINLVKGRIEGTPEGKELLQSQLRIVRKLKGKIIDESNKEMEIFRKFREYSKMHPEVTYEEFVKSNM